MPLSKSPKERIRLWTFSLASFLPLVRPWSQSYVQHLLCHVPSHGMPACFSSISLHPQLPSRFLALPPSPHTSRSPGQNLYICCGSCPNPQTLTSQAFHMAVLVRALFPWSSAPLSCLVEAFPSHACWSSVSHNCIKVLACLNIPHWYLRLLVGGIPVPYTLPMGVYAP